MKNPSGKCQEPASHLSTSGGTGRQAGTARAPVVRTSLARDLLETSFIAETAHILLAFIWIVLIVDRLVLGVAGFWMLGIVLAAGARPLLRLIIHRRAHFPLHLLTAFRISVLALTIVWVTGILLFGRFLSVEQLALLMVVLAALIAVEISTLAADKISFFTLAAGLLVAIEIVILRQAGHAFYSVSGILVPVFGILMAAAFRRNHRTLIQNNEARDQVERHNTELAQKQAYLEALLASAPTAITTVDENGRILDINPAFEDTFGYSSEEAVGKIIDDLIVPPEDRGTAEALEDHVFGGGQVAVDVERLHREGRRVPVNILAQLVKGVAETTAFVMYVDRTDANRAMKELKEARRAAEKAAEAKTAFLANMSHEIRTPMNGVLGMMELLQFTELDAEQRRLVELARGSAEALLSVVNDILDFSKIESGHLELEELAFDLRSLVETTVRVFAARAQERGVELLCEVTDEIPQAVRGDAGRLRQVLNNLISNAIKFTREGEVVVRVSPVGRDDGRERIEFAVQDTGIGIAADKLSQIFEDFMQADASMTRHYGGTGLGLAISRRLVELMGGEIEVESVLGQGSTFRFTLPLQVELDPLPVVAAGLEGLAGSRVLVVDDSTTNRRIVRDMLWSIGASVEEAADADDALAALYAVSKKEDRPDLVVLDAQMPGRDGFELGQLIKSDPELATIRLVMLTSAGRPGDGQRCRELGIAGYLEKPIGRAAFLQVLAAVMNQPAQTIPEGPLVTRHYVREARRRLTILLAEDNPVNQEVAAGILRKRGHEVDVTANGALAVKAAERKRYDVVLMDVEMPEMDGLTATRQLRSLPGWEQVPIIALTAHALEESAQQCREAGMTGFLVKPFKGQDLFATVEGAAAEQAVRRGIVPPPSEGAKGAHSGGP